MFKSIKNIVCGFIISLAISGIAHAGQAIIMFGTSAAPDQSDVNAVLDQKAAPGDYYSIELVSSLLGQTPSDTTLLTVVGAGHVFATPLLVKPSTGSPNSYSVSSYAQDTCGLDANGNLHTGTIAYDAEPSTDPNNARELLNIRNSITTATGLVTGTCHTLALSLYPENIGIDPGACSYKISARPDGKINLLYDNVKQPVNWSGVSLVVLQAQSLLNDGFFACPPVATPAFIRNYTQAVGQIARVLRKKNPQMLIIAQVSLAFSSKGTAVTAMKALYNPKHTTNPVDGFYIAYPGAQCPACTAANLGALIDAVRPPPVAH